MYFKLLDIRKSSHVLILASRQKEIVLMFVEIYADIKEKIIRSHIMNDSIEKRK